jgi:hypothetical protein
MPGAFGFKIDSRLSPMTFTAMSPTVLFSRYWTLCFGFAKARLAGNRQLIIPTQNDERQQLRHMSRWILENLGPEVPVHFTRFHPLYLMQNFAADTSHHS